MARHKSSVPSGKVAVESTTTKTAQRKKSLSANAKKSSQSSSEPEKGLSIHAILNGTDDSKPLDNSATLSSIPKYEKRSLAEKKLLHKFDTEVLSSEMAMKTLSDLRGETQEKYLYQIRRYIRHCANRGLDNFFVTKTLAKELIQSEISRRGQISENTIKSIRSPLNKLYHMNRIVYPNEQPFELLSDDLIEELVQSYTGKVKTSTTIPAPSAPESATEGEDIDATKIIKLGKVAKKKLSTNEIFLLQMFTNHIINSEKTKPILQNLTGKTFKAYSTDMKRFIRYCASQNMDNFLLNNDVLRSYLRHEVQNSSSGYASTRLKNLRSSLLKLNQLNRIAFDSAYHEKNLVDVMSEFLREAENLESKGILSSNKSTEDEKILQSNGIVYNQRSNLEESLFEKLNEMYTHSKILNGLTEASKRLYSAEIKRYVQYCASKGLNNFKLNGEMLKSFLIEDIIPKTPHITTKKLKEILSRLNRLHQLNNEGDESQPRQSRIPNMKLVKDFLESYEAGNETGEDELLLEKEESAAFSEAIKTARRAQKRSANDDIIRKQDVLHQIVDSGVVDGAWKGNSTVEEHSKKRSRLSSQPTDDNNEKQPRKEQLYQFHMNSSISTVVEVVEEWTLVTERVERWDLKWIRNDRDLQLYNARKRVIELIKELSLELDNRVTTDVFQDKAPTASSIYEHLSFEIAVLIDQYIIEKQLSLDDLTRKIETFPTHSKREFIRILSRRK
ncbi:uncharacterized protein RJT20DRAFT_34841 [Scheffersomyces xylosifermentans]|uniref:uncharacterized protein n=1 Tax=Scheffersomyces xylosifermentans TaxID=1304137 RepID=UPI00315D0CFE